MEQPATSLQAATQFFYDHIGYRIIDADPLPSYAQRVDMCTCTTCGRRSAGVFDARPNQQAHRCLPCWSFFHPAPSVFAGTGRDQSFTGTVKNHWILDASGTLTVFMTEKSLLGDAPANDSGGDGASKKPRIGKDAQAALRAGIVYRAAPRAGIVRGILRGEFSTPLLWAAFGQNKDKSLSSLELSEDLSHVVLSDAGEPVHYDFHRVGRVLEVIETLTPGDPAAVQAMLDWFGGADLRTAMDATRRLAFRRSIRAAGLPLDALLVPLSERSLCRSLAGEAWMTHSRR